MKKSANRCRSTHTDTLKTVNNKGHPIWLINKKNNHGG
jgi:hypothetical protein